jgi:glycosyltransferase involved in cell wall biosynthesis
VLSVLFITPHVSPDQAGAAKALFALANHVAETRQGAVTMACDDAAQGVLVPEIAIRRLAEPRTLPLLWRIHGFVHRRRVAAMMRAAGLPKVDIAYAASVDHAVAFAQLNRRTPVVLHAGATVSSREILTESKPGLASKLNARGADNAVRTALGLSNIIHVVSTRLVAEERAAFYGVDKNIFHVSPYGVDEKRFVRGGSYPDVRAALGIPGDAFVACTAARLVDWKRIDLLLSAAKLAKAEPWVVVVGDGISRAKLEARAAELQVTPRVRFVGFADPSPYLAASDVFVLPSEIESFGLAYAEAMAMGLPCIGRRYRPPLVISSARDVIPDEAGFLVDDDAELAGRLDLLAGNREMSRRMGALAHAHAVRYYTTAAYFERIKAFIETRVGIRREAWT